MIAWSLLHSVLLVYPTPPGNCGPPRVAATIVPGSESCRGRSVSNADSSGHRGAGWRGEMFGEGAETWVLEPALTN